MDAEDIVTVPDDKGMQLYIHYIIDAFNKKFNRDPGTPIIMRAKPGGAHLAPGGSGAMRTASAGNLDLLKSATRASGVGVFATGTGSPAPIRHNASTPVSNFNKVTDDAEAPKKTFNPGNYNTIAVTSGSKKPSVLDRYRPAGDMQRSQSEAVLISPERSTSWAREPEPELKPVASSEVFSTHELRSEVTTTTSAVAPRLTVTADNSQENEALIRSLRAQLAEARSELESEKAKFALGKRELEEKLRDLEAESRRDRRRLEEEKRVLEDKVSSMERSAGSTTSVLEEKRSLESKMSDLEGRMRREREALEDANKVLATKLKSAEGEQRKGKEDLEDLEDEMRGLRTKLKAAETIQKKEKEDLVELEEENRALRTKVRDLESRAAATPAVIGPPKIMIPDSAKDDQLDLLRDQLAALRLDMKNERVRLEGEKAALESKVKDQNAQLDKMTRHGGPDVAELRELVEDLEMRNDMLQMSLEDMRRMQMEVMETSSSQDHHHQPPQQQQQQDRLGAPRTDSPGRDGLLSPRSVAAKGMTDTELAKHWERRALAAEGDLKAIRAKLEQLQYNVGATIEAPKNAELKERLGRLRKSGTMIDKSKPIVKGEADDTAEKVPLRRTKTLSGKSRSKDSSLKEKSTLEPSKEAGKSSVEVIGGGQEEKSARKPTLRKSKSKSGTLSAIANAMTKKKDPKEKE